MGKQYGPRSDAAERGVHSGSTLLALNTGISIKHGTDRHKPDIPSIGNGPVQRAELEESTEG